jgi:hypothetical protein
VGETAFDAESYLRHLESRGLTTDDTLALLCVGSMARGWANEGSDIDVYVITEAAAKPSGASQMTVPLSPPVIPAVIDHVDDRRWEIKYWTDGQVDGMLSKVDRTRLASGSVGDELAEIEENFIERLVSARSITRPEWLARRKQQVTDSTYRAYLVTRSLNKAEGSAEDAVGQLAADDLCCAVLSAHGAMRHTVDALLESMGCFGSLSPKWRPRRMRDASPSLLSFDEYWDMETMRGLDRADPREWIRSIVAWCERTAGEIEVQ